MIIIILSHYSNAFSYKIKMINANILSDIEGSKVSLLLLHYFDIVKLNTIIKCKWLCIICI